MNEQITKNWFKIFDWKFIIACAVLIYAISFSFQVYGDYKIARSNLKLRAAEFVSGDSQFGKAAQTAKSTYGKEEAESFANFLRDILKK